MKKLVSSLILVSLLQFANADELPDLGDYSATVMSAQDEKNIAEQVMKDVMSSDEVLSDPEVTDYLQNLGNKLALVGPEPNQTFQFFVVKDNTINAFSIPGGVIGVHTGLIIAATNEAELAGVLGHEIGHVVQHHMARILAQQKNDQYLNIAGIALAILTARANPQLANAAMVGSTAGTLQKQLDFSRDYEREADRVGISILQKAGYDPNAMVSFFEIMQKGSRFVDGNAPSFLRTHPVTSERIADVSARISSTTSHFSMQVYGPDFDYIKAKIFATVYSPKEAITIFNNSLKEKRYFNEAAQHYGLSLSDLRMGDYEHAMRELDWLNSNVPPHPFFTHLKAQVYLAQKNLDLTKETYETGVKQFPESRALIEGYADFLQMTGQSAKVLEFLKNQQEKFPEDPYLYEVKAKTYWGLGKKLLSYQAQAEAYVRRYDLKKAYEQIELAVKAADGDFYQQSIVEARRKEIRFLLEEPKKKGWFD
jgi:beta-barrel assembly-enhancing protease